MRLTLTSSSIRVIACSLFICLLLILSRPFPSSSLPLYLEPQQQAQITSKVDPIHGIQVSDIAAVPKIEDISDVGMAPAVSVSQIYPASQISVEYRVDLFARDRRRWENRVLQWEQDGGNDPVAICLCGLLRGFSLYHQVREQFIKGLVEPFQKLKRQVHVVIVTDSEEETMWTHDVMDFLEEYPQLFLTLMRVKGLKPSQQGYKMSQCAKWLYPFRHQYEWVVFTRPDLIYLHPFNPDQLRHGFVSARIREAPSSNAICGLNLQPLTEESVSFAYYTYGLCTLLYFDAASDTLTRS
jgi:hypothetical protein